MRLFFSLLALVANAATLLFVVAAIAGGVSAAGAGFRDRIVGAVAGWELWFAAAVATTATLGSLYLSEIVHLVPCTFCWYQRIAMYPLAVILLIAAARRDHGVRLYVTTLAVIGAGLAAYHRLLQLYPSLDSGSCNVGVPCTAAYFELFGFVSIPYLAFSAFTLILALMWADRRNSAVVTPSFRDENKAEDHIPA
jgi:disulfide bond formation protein DsbB